MSKYEQILEQILVKNKVIFVREKTFVDLKRGSYRFDFFLPQSNIVIEVNGEQHYKQVKCFQKTRKDFLAAQERDRRKISWCLANKIKIYCIPYWEIKNIKSLEQVFQDKFLAKTKWKNDEDWKKYVLNKK